MLRKRIFYCCIIFTVIAASGVLFDCGGVTTGPQVYVAGSYESEAKAFLTTACYWKNDEFGVTDLYDTAYAEAHSIILSGSDVYVAGIYDNGETNVACYWKNNMENRTDLYETATVHARGIYVSGSDVYVAGYYLEGDNYVACYWKNDENGRTDLYTAQYVSAHSVYYVP